MSKTIISKLNNNNLTHINPHQIPETLNEHFSEIASKLDNTLRQANRNAVEYLQGNNLNSVSVPLVNDEDITKVITSLKTLKTKFCTHCLPHCLVIQPTYYYCEIPI